MKFIFAFLLLSLSLHARTFDESIKERTKELEQLALILNVFTNQTPIEDKNGVKLRCLKTKEHKRLWRWYVEKSLERERFYPFAREFENQICVEEEGFQNIIKGTQHKIAEIKQLEQLPANLSKKSKKELMAEIETRKAEVESLIAQVSQDVTQENRRTIMTLGIAVAALIILVVYLGIPLLIYATLFTILVGALQIGIALKDDYNAYVTQKTSLKQEMIVHSQKALEEFDKIQSLKQKRLH